MCPGWLPQRGSAGPAGKELAAGRAGRWRQSLSLTGRIQLRAVVRARRTIHCTMVLSVKAPRGSSRLVKLTCGGPSFLVLRSVPGTLLHSLLLRGKPLLEEGLGGGGRDRSCAAAAELVRAGANFAFVRVVHSWLVTCGYVVGRGWLVTGVRGLGRRVKP